MAEANTLDSGTFEFVYDGPDVQSGSMSASDVAEALTGLTRAFNGIARSEDLSDQYEIRVRNIGHASFHILFEAVAFAKANPAATSALATGAAVNLDAITNTVSGAYKVITDLGAMITAKAKAHGERVANLKIEIDNGKIRLDTPEGQVLLTKEQYEILLRRKVDAHLSQIVSPLKPQVSPLKPQKVDIFRLKRGADELAVVEAKQKLFFEHREQVFDSKPDGSVITGTLNSLSKTSLKGTFYTQDGIHVPYRYTGGDVASLLRGFTSKEAIRVYGKIKYGVDGIPTHIEVQEIDALQRQLIQ